MDGTFDAPTSSVSKPQKLLTPTFQVPSWYTEVPTSFLSATAPSSRTS